ncbi:MAG: hypothetical protein IK004_09225 [Bacteroidales bacterium]|nr:hypothetical protein [Bacteroidales bacterium]
MRKISLFIVSLAALSMVSCTKNNDSTLTFLGEEQYVEDIVKVIPKKARDVFEQRFGEIYTGDKPPKIEGEFMFAPKKRDTSNVNINTWPLDVYEPNVYLKFMNQHNKVAKLIHYEETETVIDTVYVMGHDSYFTVYYVENKKMDYGIYDVRVKRGIIYKGRITEDGIRNLKYASIIMDVYDSSNGVLDLYPAGSFFLYYDKDKLSERYNWYYN